MEGTILTQIAEWLHNLTAMGLPPVAIPFCFILWKINCSIVALDKRITVLEATWRKWD